MADYQGYQDIDDPGYAEAVDSDIRVVRRTRRKKLHDPGLSARQDYQELSDRLAKNERGAVLPTHANMMLILTFDPILSGMVKFNAFTGMHMLQRPIPSLDKTIAPAPGPYPRPWDGDDITRLLAFVQKTFAPNFKKTTVEECLLLDGSDHQYHEVLDYLNALKWDGEKRLDRWLTVVFGCPSDDYHQAIAAKLQIAAVRRVRQPGCKHDHLVVFEGDQGILKSSVISALFGADWYTDQISDISSKDAAGDLRGKWVVEFSEIEKLIKADVETLKSFVSRPIDHYRPPYGRRTIDIPRQGVFTGTTNDQEYLRDPSGNRRIWPLKCGKGKANIDWVRANRDQLWAESATREAEGESIWFDDTTIQETAEAEQAARMHEDPWEPKVRLYCDSKVEIFNEWTKAAERTGDTTLIEKHMQAYPADLRGGMVTVPEVLEFSLNVATVFQTKGTEMRVANILRTMKWEKDRFWDNDLKKRRRAWFPPDSTDSRRGK
jgi:predicted P-loop ATPase